MKAAWERGKEESGREDAKVRGVGGRQEKAIWQEEERLQAGMTRAGRAWEAKSSEIESRSGCSALARWLVG